MISKSSVGMLLAVAALFFAVPSAPVLAASSSADKAKIKKYYDQLKKLPTGASPYSKVNSLVTKLSKLDPKKASKYYKLGLTKLSNATGTASADATKMATSVNKVLKKSGLPSSQIAKLQKQVDKANDTYVPPATPTPTPTS